MLDRQGVIDKIREVMRDELGAKDADMEDLSNDDNFIDKLGPDSLDVVELVMKFEDAFSEGEFKLEIPDEEVKELTSVNLIADFVIKNLPKAA